MFIVGHVFGDKDHRIGWESRDILRKDVFLSRQGMVIDGAKGGWCRDTRDEACGLWPSEGQNGERRSTCPSSLIVRVL